MVCLTGKTSSWSCYHSQKLHHSLAFINITGMSILLHMLSIYGAMVSSIIMFGALIAPVLEVKLGVGGGTEVEEGAHGNQQLVFEAKMLSLQSICCPAPHLSRHQLC